MRQLTLTEDMMWVLEVRDCLDRCLLAFETVMPSLVKSLQPIPRKNRLQDASNDFEVYRDLSNDELEDCDNQDVNKIDLAGDMVHLQEPQDINEINLAGDRVNLVVISA